VLHKNSTIPVTVPRINTMTSRFKAKGVGHGHDARFEEALEALQSSAIA